MDHKRYKPETHPIIGLSLALALLLFTVPAPAAPAQTCDVFETSKVWDAPIGDDWVWRTFTSDNSPLAPGDVNALLADDQGRVWAGTFNPFTGDGGVSVYQGGRGRPGPATIAPWLRVGSTRCWPTTRAGCGPGLLILLWAKAG